MVLPLRENPSAPAQGALAVEISRERADIRELLAPLNCPDTFSAVLSERQILRSYGGGCHQKLGANIVRRPFGEITLFRGLSDNGEVLDRLTLGATKPRPPQILRNEVLPLYLSKLHWFVR